MNNDRQLRKLHTAVTAQFTASAALIIFWSLYEAHLDWWAVFSISAHGIVIVFLGVLIYGFAVFRGAVGERIEAEHPLSGSVYYRFFYVLVPILGGIAVGSDYLLGAGPLEAVRGIALGTVLSAYVVWLFVDPALGMIESALPESRRLRAERLAAQRAKREALRTTKKRLLDEIRAKHREVLDGLRELIEERERELAELLAATDSNPAEGANRGALVALEIWQAGGMASLRELYTGVVERFEGDRRRWYAAVLDYWWDGVGDWKRREHDAASAA